MKIAAHIFILFFGLCCLSGCKEKYPSQSAITAPDYKKGVSLLGNKNDSAFYYFNKVTSRSKDSLEIATSYNNMAAIQSDAGDYFGAQESLLASLQYLKENRERDYYCLSSDYNELGTTSLNLKNYNEAIDYYSLAIKFVKDDNYKKIFENNQALCYQKIGDYAKALALYRNISPKLSTDRKTYARVLTNVAITHWLQDSNYNAAPELWQALSIRKKENDDWGLNSSYGHFADYYMKSRPDSAFFYADAFHSVAQKLNSPDDELEALQKMLLLTSGKNGNAYFIRYQFLKDSLETSRNNAKNQFALIRYDAAKNKADNLKLQTENAKKKLQILWQWVLLLGILAALLFGGIILNGRLQKRKQQLIWASEKAIRDNQFRTSQKVHDIVANGLYSIMTEIEHNENLEKEKLLDKIEVLYEKSRNISYEQPEVVSGDFEELIGDLLMSFASQDIKVLVVGNYKNLLNNLNEAFKTELQHILKELMINMKKHSGAQNVVIKFERKADRISVQYNDDGKGLPPVFKYGNGLNNTENRIKAMGGEINFVTKDSKGLNILFYFPISPA